MDAISPEFLARSKAVFLTRNGPSLADLKRLAEADKELTDIQRRDLVSALNRLPTLFRIPLEEVEARPGRVRDLFASKSAAQVNLSEKTFANIRSLVGQSLERYAEPAEPLTRRFPLDASWRALLDPVVISYQRQALSRLAAYCSAMGIPPGQVTSETLVGLKVAIEAEEVIKNPKVILKNTIASWNRAMRAVPEWPQHVLASPSQRRLLALPLSAFPVSFQEDVAAWQERMANPDPLDEEAPARALRPATIEHRIFQFRQFASALVQSGYRTAEEVRALRDLLAPDAFKTGLRVYLDRIGRTQAVHNMARTFRLIAKHYCGFDEPTLASLEKICRKLDPGNRRQMTERNRKRLTQFDDPRNVARLLRFPDEEVRRADRQANPVRAAKSMERALAVSLLIHCGFRITTLRTLKLSDFTFTSAGLCILSVPGERTKAGRPLEHELNTGVTALLRRHLAEHRLRLPGSDGPYLFPGTAGGARSKNATYEAICSALRRHAGLEMNPHLFRHAIAKIAVEADPGAYLAVSRVLGHSTLDTTMGHYLGTESKAAGRHVDRLLSDAKDHAPMAKGRR